MLEHDGLHVGQGLVVTVGEVHAGVATDEPTRQAGQPDQSTGLPAVFAENLVLTAQPDAPRNQDAAEAVPTTDTSGADSRLVLLPSAGAVEFDTVIAASGLLAVIPSVQRISLGPNRGGQRAHVWVDEYTVHILINAELAKHRLRIGGELARPKVVLRLDGHLIHVVHNDVLAKTLPSPIPVDQYTKIRGARIAASQSPPRASGPVCAQRKVPKDGVVMVARQRLRVGRTYSGKIVTIYVEDTHFRVTCDGAQLFMCRAPRGSSDQCRSLSALWVLPPALSRAWPRRPRF